MLGLFDFGEDKWCLSLICNGKVTKPMLRAVPSILGHHMELVQCSFQQMYNTISLYWAASCDIAGDGSACAGARGYVVNNGRFQEIYNPKHRRLGLRGLCTSPA